MNKSTLVFVGIATLLIGGLIGMNIGSDGAASTPAVSAGNAEPAAEMATTAAADTPDAAGNSGSTLNYRLIKPGDFTVQQDEFGKAAPATVGENLTVTGKAFKHETLTIQLALDEQLEYKVEMEQGDSVVYRWNVKDGEVYYDFHGHPKVEETEFFTRYLEGEGAEHAGSIVAPYKGQHGWFWLNISDQAITVELEVAGFYDQIVKVDLEGY